jgi:hypothetical protein
MSLVVSFEISSAKTFNTGDTGDHGVVPDAFTVCEMLMLMMLDLTGGRKEGSNVRREKEKRHLQRHISRW